MRPRTPIHLLDEMRFHLDQSLRTGILQWQELAHLEFQDLINLVYARNAFREEMRDG